MWMDQSLRNYHYQLNTDDACIIKKYRMDAETNDIEFFMVFFMPNVRSEYVPKLVRSSPHFSICNLRFAPKFKFSFFFAVQKKFPVSVNYST